MSKTDILRVNIAAGLIAGAIIGIGEILIGELFTRKAARELVSEATAPPQEISPDAPGSGD